MTTLQFADTHNLVAFLSKRAESEGSEQIIDFLNANPIKYALTINPTIYTSCIEQFYATVKVKTVNGEESASADNLKSSASKREEGEEGELYSNALHDSIKSGIDVESFKELAAAVPPSISAPVESLGGNINPNSSTSREVSVVIMPAENILKRIDRSFEEGAHFTCIASTSLHQSLLDCSRIM
ncbi:hypothetical protein Tco_0047142 [Tanacetum coccineum]